jgi:cytochrome c peroxidase
MHDGRFATLEAVLDHYSEGVQNSPNLVPPLSHGPQENMTQAEKDAVIAFLKTLTDTTMLENPKFSDPFALR